MSVVPCPFCSGSVTLPTPWTGTAYTCPHCRRVVSTGPPPRPPAPPLPPPSPAKSDFDLSDDDDDDDDTPAPRRVRRRPRAPGGFGDFITFRLMITPILIQIVFWLAVFLCATVGLMIIAGSFAMGRNQGEAVAFAVVSMVLGPLLARLYCEMMLIIFKIHDELKAANDRERYRG
ncbi:MAG: DUF4282 domain-containing protein [Planctomycetes bacterium]|nr:DUF4282 domain-containing protein [Planctomycetota bacterium]